MLKGLSINRSLLFSFIPLLTINSSFATVSAGNSETQYANQMLAQFTFISWMKG